MGHIFTGKSVDDVSCTLGTSFDIFTCHAVQLTVDDFKQAVLKVQAEEPDITHWTFGKWVARSQRFLALVLIPFPV